MPAEVFVGTLTLESSVPEGRYGPFHGISAYFGHDLPAGTYALTLTPEVPMLRPEKEQSPSAEYLTGYRDGFGSSYWATVQWYAFVDYRSGWTTGAYDRIHGLPNEYPV